jgi:hypothetical protein
VLAERTIRRVIVVVYFPSGAAGLVYQVLWTRQLSLIFGVTTYAVATVLATFMGGLAIGSWVLGRWVDSCQNPLAWYALLELGIGLYALLVTPLLELLTGSHVALRRLARDAARAAYDRSCAGSGRGRLAALVSRPGTYRRSKPRSSSQSVTTRSWASSSWRAVCR